MAAPSTTLNRVIPFQVGVEIVVFSIDITSDSLLVLLGETGGGLWQLPGAEIQAAESLEQAADRVLRQTLRVDNLYLEQLYTFGGPGRDNRETPYQRYLAVSYVALVRLQATTLLQEHRTVTWHPVQALPPLVGDHRQIAAYGYRRLRNKLEYSPVAFDILPEEFTLNELYQVYTLVLGPQFSDYSNFRTRLLKLGFLVDTGHKICRGAGRPATLYRFDREAFQPYQNQPLVFV